MRSSYRNKCVWRSVSAWLKANRTEPSAEPKKKTDALTAEHDNEFSMTRCAFRSPRKLELESSPNIARIQFKFGQSIAPAIRESRESSSKARCYLTLDAAGE